MFKKISKYIGPRASAAGIIFKGNKILLEKRSKRIIIEGGKWGLPGGNLKYGEKAEEAVKREIKEELGLDVKKIRFLFYQDEIIPKFHLHNIVLVFKISVSGKIKTNWEVADTGWFTQKEIEKLNLAYNHKNIIKRFFKERNFSK